ncbi:hypothetical protein P171DRAFT_449122 [Karstenula rhodostoma CBS 690.94]|uniref:Uncharacterized protein n=1 Tax=Karstenula rhodostoma CBS 690.94 TaxID=1392251 RepID=A0A9P4U4Z4_9PLEO|nr:hypothetical protein P171DRAFT_449122 [Karstenula rhodostoma CBS 690.94]
METCAGPSWALAPHGFRFHYRNTKLYTCLLVFLNFTNFTFAADATVHPRDWHRIHGFRSAKAKRDTTECDHDTDDMCFNTIDMEHERHEHQIAIGIAQDLFYELNEENWEIARPYDLLLGWSQDPNNYERFHSEKKLRPDLTIISYLPESLIGWKGMHCDVKYEDGCRNMPTQDYILAHLPLERHRARQLKFSLIAIQVSSVGEVLSDAAISVGEAMPLEAAEAAEAGFPAAVEAQEAALVNEMTNIATGSDSWAANPFSQVGKVLGEGSKIQRLTNSIADSVLELTTDSAAQLAEPATALDGTAVDTTQAAEELAQDIIDTVEAELDPTTLTPPGSEWDDISATTSSDLESIPELLDFEELADLPLDSPQRIALESRFYQQVAATLLQVRRGTLNGVDLVEAVGINTLSEMLNSFFFDHLASMARIIDTLRGLHLTELPTENEPQIPNVDGAWDTHDEDRPPHPDEHAPHQGSSPNHPEVPSHTFEEDPGNTHQEHSPRHPDEQNVPEPRIHPYSSNFAVHPDVFRVHPSRDRFENQVRRMARNLYGSERYANEVFVWHGREFYMDYWICYDIRNILGESGPLYKLGAHERTEAEGPFSESTIRFFFRTILASRLHDANRTLCIGCSLEFLAFRPRRSYQKLDTKRLPGENLPALPEEVGHSEPSRLQILLFRLWMKIGRVLRLPIPEKPLPDFQPERPTRPNPPKRPKPPNYLKETRPPFVPPFRDQYGRLPKHLDIDVRRRAETLQEYIRSSPSIRLWSIGGIFREGQYGPDTQLSATGFVNSPSEKLSWQQLGQSQYKAHTRATNTSLPNRLHLGSSLKGGELSAGLLTKMALKHEQVVGVFARMESFALEDLMQAPADETSLYHQVQINSTSFFVTDAAQAVADQIQSGDHGLTGDQVVRSTMEFLLVARHDSQELSKKSDGSPDYLGSRIARRLRHVDGTPMGSLEARRFFIQHSSTINYHRKKLKEDESFFEDTHVELPQATSMRTNFLVVPGPGETSWLNILGGVDLLRKEYFRNEIKTTGECSIDEYTGDHTKNLKNCHGFLNDAVDPVVRKLGYSIREMENEQDWEPHGTAPFVYYLTEQFFSYKTIKRTTHLWSQHRSIEEKMFGRLKNSLVAKAWADESCFVKCSPKSPHGHHKREELFSLEDDVCRAVCHDKTEQRAEGLYGLDHVKNLGAESPPWNLNKSNILKVSHAAYMEHGAGAMLPGSVNLNPFDVVYENIAPPLPVCRSELSTVSGSNVYHKGSATYPCSCGDKYGNETLAFMQAAPSGWRGQGNKQENRILETCLKDKRLKSLAQSAPAAYLSNMCQIVYGAVSPSGVGSYMELKNKGHYKENRNMCTYVMNFVEDNKHKGDRYLDDGVCKIWYSQAVDRHRNFDISAGLIVLFWWSAFLTDKHKVDFSDINHELNHGACKGYKDWWKHSCKKGKNWESPECGMPCPGYGYGKCLT